MRLVFHELLLPCLFGRRSGGQRGSETGLTAMRAEVRAHHALSGPASLWGIKLPWIVGLPPAAGVHHRAGQLRVARHSNQPPMNPARRKPVTKYGHRRISDHRNSER